jgi:membrane fusion protein (multidrug efflux system)
MRHTYRFFAGLLLFPLLFLCIGRAGMAAEGSSSFEARGVVKARQRAVIASEIAALVNRLPLRAGESFRQGDLLVGFDCRLFEAQKDKVDAELRAAKMRYENSRQLDEMSSIGALEVQMAAMDVEKAKAEFRMASLNVERCTINAPYDGRVVRLMVNEEESVHMQQELLEIVGASSLEAEIVVPGSWLQWLTPGWKLTMTIDETGEDIVATVAAVGAVVDPASQSMIVRARFNGKHRRPLIPGMRGLAHFAPPHGAGN